MSLIVERTNNKSMWLRVVYTYIEYYERENAVLRGRFVQLPKDRLMELPSLRSYRRWKFESIEILLLLRNRSATRIIC